MVLWRRAGSVASIHSAEHTTLTTTPARRPGTARQRVSLRTIMHKITRPMPRAISIRAESSLMISWRPTTTQITPTTPAPSIETRLPPLARRHPQQVVLRPPSRLVTMPPQLDRGVSLMAGRSVSRWRVDRITSITTPARQHGWTPADKPSFALWVPAGQALRCSPKPSHSSVPCRPVGRCA